MAVAKIYVPELLDKCHEIAIKKDQNGLKNIALVGPFSILIDKSITLRDPHRHLYPTE